MPMYVSLIGVFTLIVLGIVWLSYRMRDRLSTMKTMMMSMSLGMVVGTCFGTVLAMVNPQSSFNVTIIAILLGAAAGFLSGLPHGIVPILNGFLAGMMGGMMGAMLGATIPANYVEHVAEILAIVSSIILILLFLMMQEDFAENEGRWISFFRKPQTLFLIFGVFVFIAYQTSFASTDVSADNHSHHDMAASEHVNVIVSATEYAFNPKEIQVKTGETILLSLQNEGTVKHEIEVENTEFEVYADPGKTEQTTMTFDKPGEYEIVCDMPGHKEAGMVGKIIVTQK